MTNETQKPIKQLEILFGDDQFADASTRYFFQKDYAPMLQERVPSIQFNWKYETSHEETIREAQTGKYEVVVTDLNYTNGKEEGYEVVEKACRVQPKPLVILCTASNSPELRTKAVDADYIATSNERCFHKFDGLVEVLAKHFGGRTQ